MRLPHIVTIIISAIVGILVIVYLIVNMPIYFPRSIEVHPMLNDSKSGNFTAQDQNYLYFYAAYNGQKGIYRLDLRKKTVSLFQQTEEVDSLALSNDTLYYSFASGTYEGPISEYSLKSVNKTTLKTDTVENYTYFYSKLSIAGNQLYYD